MEEMGKEEPLSYVAPEIRTMTEAELLERMGPAQAYTGTVPFGF